ncbi:hypothetical protein RFM23_31205 [Mesorhizobium abyssinicae]|uniref:Uncharacterized protein n=1 Tax=Mesorhizobium abyssinicae TaxID=1209958 RepID=A0ABU5AXN1_9HYPH|nr:hypothetical protein [Mesorhizobium abyssinicae]
MIIRGSRQQSRKSARGRLAALLRAFPQERARLSDYLPRKVDDDCLIERRWSYGRRAPIAGQIPKAGDLGGDNIEERLSFLSAVACPPQAHEVNEHAGAGRDQAAHLVVRIFPNPQSCVGLVQALAVGIHKTWLEGTR